MLDNKYRTAIFLCFVSIYEFIVLETVLQTRMTVMAFLLNE